MGVPVALEAFVRALDAVVEDSEVANTATLNALSFPKFKVKSSEAGFTFFYCCALLAVLQARLAFFNPVNFMFIVPDPALANTPVPLCV